MSLGNPKIICPNLIDPRRLTPNLWGLQLPADVDHELVHAGLENDEFDTQGERE